MRFVFVCVLLVFATTVFAERFEFEEPHMGVPIRIVLHGTDAAAAKQAADAAFKEFEKLNGIMSDYDSDSELSRLSSRSTEEFDKTGNFPWIPVGDELFAVLQASKRYSELSDGAFDITVAPLVRLWRRARRMRELPKKEYIVKAKELVGNDVWEIDTKTRSVRFNKKGVRLDLGGIAKGYAIDRAFEIVRNAGFETALVDAGGDIRVGKSPPDDCKPNAWKIVGPDGKSESPANQAIATSGSTFQFVEIDGVRYSHIVDPKTGYGLTTRFVVQVSANTACEADALASAFSVLGPEKSAKILERFHGVSVRFVDSETKKKVRP